MVVDDAIVVVEDVERNMAAHHLAGGRRYARSEIDGSLDAGGAGDGLGFGTDAFLAGRLDRAALHRQFAITIVVSVVISGFVALTLTPAMCALMLRHTAAAARSVRLVQPPGRPHHARFRPRRRVGDQGAR